MGRFDDISSPDTVAADCWAMLAEAPSDPTSGWRLPVLATTSSAQTPRQRTVVLRQVDAATRRIVAHTDRRSAKFAELKARPASSWLFWDAARKVQLTLEGKAELHTDCEFAERIWKGEPESSLRAYLAPHEPGQIMAAADVNLPESVRGRIPDREELHAGRSNFAVISCIVSSAECVILRSNGNLRARFQYSANGDVQSDWLAP